MNNSKKKVFILEVIQDEQDHTGFGLQIRTQIDGFNPLQLIGILEMKKAEIIAEMKPTKKFNPRNPNVN